MKAFFFNHACVLVYGAKNSLKAFSCVQDMTKNTSAIASRLHQEWIVKNDMFLKQIWDILWQVLFVRPPTESIPFL